MGRRLVVLSDPSVIGEVTGSASANYRLTNMHLRMLSPALGRGIIVAEGEGWRRQRRAAIKLLTQARPSVGDGFTEDLVLGLVRSWQRGPAELDIQPDLTLLSIDLLAAELFHHRKKVGDGRVAEAIGRHRRIVERADLLDVIGAPPWIRTPRLRSAGRIVRQFDTDIHAAISESTHFSLGPEFEREARRDFVVNLMSGFESIANTATWLIGIIAAHQPLYDWLVDCRASAADRSTRLNGAISETLRLYPPLPLVYRQAVADHQTSAGRIARGSMVCISPYVVHRHEALWSHPGAFDPQRVMPAGKPSAYIPFGHGARQCLGKMVGPRLIAMIVSAVLENFRLALPGALPLPRAGLSLRPSVPMVVGLARA